MEKISRVKKHIIIMGVIMILLSLTAGIPNVWGLLVWALLPLVCSILFIIFKNPIFGIICTVSFISNRILLFGNGITLLAAILILALTGYFIYVNIISVKAWKIHKENIS